MPTQAICDPPFGTWCRTVRGTFLRPRAMCRTHWGQPGHPPANGQHQRAAQNVQSTAPQLMPVRTTREAWGQVPTRPTVLRTRGCTTHHRLSQAAPSEQQEGGSGTYVLQAPRAKGPALAHRPRPTPALWAPWGGCPGLPPEKI